MSQQTVDKIVQGNSPTRRYRFVSEGQTLSAAHYMIDYAPKSGVSLFCASVCIAVPGPVAVMEWVFVFDEADKTLITWGTINEIAMSADPAARALAGDLKLAYLESLARR